MHKLHWSEVAEADLDDIYSYIARDVPYYAEMFVDRLIEATDKLEDQAWFKSSEHFCVSQLAHKCLKH